MVEMKIRVGSRVYFKSIPDQAFHEVKERVKEICYFNPQAGEWVLDPRRALARGWRQLVELGVDEEEIRRLVSGLEEQVKRKLEEMAEAGLFAAYMPASPAPPPLRKAGDYAVIGPEELRRLAAKLGPAKALEEVKKAASRGYFVEEHLTRLLSLLDLTPKAVVQDGLEGLIVYFQALTEEQKTELDFMRYVVYNERYRGEVVQHRIRLLHELKPGVYRAPYFMIHHIKSFTRRHSIKLEEKVSWPLERIEVGRRDYELYGFQREAVDAWEENGYFGTVVIPTGGGKTYVGMEAIYRLRVKTLVCVVTEELASQWRELLARKLGVAVGSFTGRSKKLGDVTVGIYNSVARYIDSIGDKFGLIVFDEVHHVPAASFKEIALRAKAKFRLGLSATPERSDQNEHLIFLCSGDVVYKIGYRELVKAGVLAEFRHHIIRVKLTDREKTQMWREMALARDEDERLMVQKRYALLAEKKIPAVLEVVEAEKGRKILIFTEYIEQAEKIHKALLEKGLKAELMVGRTRNRAEIFNAFKKGDVNILVTTRVLDEGVDVPDADVAIVASGSGSPRQMAQRVGRVLRGAPGKIADIYEVIAEGTIEEALSAKRRRALREYMKP
ncbi:MAG: ATP-dependent helicase [Thermoproteota archaeon]|nr:MAG: ATP-dependent helicase [Candidatus Korarchaeota archaeon]